MLGYVKRGGSLVRLPSKCFRISHPLLRFERIKRDFALCGGRPKGSALWKPATFEKVDETFSVVLICSDFSVLFLSVSLVLCPFLTAVNSKSVLAACFGDVHSDVGGGVKLLEVLAVIGSNSHTDT